MNSKIMSVVVVAVIVGGVGFYGGTIYSKKGSAVQMPNREDRPSGFTGAQGGRTAGNFTAGEVISRDATSFTVKLSDGGSKIVFYSASTTVGKMSIGSINDVNQGTNVTVMGATNADGSVTASNVQIRPAGDVMGMGGRGSGPAPQPAGTPSADAREIVVTSGHLKFDLSSITVKKGEKIRIRLKNEEGTHDWKVDEFNAATTKISGVGEVFVEFTADKAGTFEFYCSVGAHRQMGMKGSLIVTE